MSIKKECVAMLLAGGQGSRLFALTSKIAKPAVTFGGKYRIIDFPLSNCVNSGIDTVGVLTQYQPLILNDYVGNGQPWDLDRSFGGVHILSPYQAKEGSAWYKGTANAIYQNLQFIKRYSPEYVVILSGDHIYRMNYNEMIEYHKKTQADCTIATIEVPIEQATRFGILNTNSDGTVYEFEEKPQHPKSSLASMGIYVFTAEKLYKYLEEDNLNANSSNDFGKDVLPKMLSCGEKMCAFRFNGYWKDVGTIASLYDANMDLLGENPQFDFADTDWRIHSRNPIAPPQYIGDEAKVVNSIIALGCEISGEVYNSVLSNNVKIGKGAVIRDSVIFGNTEIGEGAVVNSSIIDEEVKVGKNAKIGSPLDAKKAIAVVGREQNIPENGIVKGGEIIG